MSSKEKIDDWFTAPIDFLDKNYHKDSGFIVLLASFCLAERLVKAVCSASGGNERDDFHRYLTYVLSVDASIAVEFWNMFRDGTMHYATPFSGKIQEKEDVVWSWHLDDSYSSLPECYQQDETNKLILLNPWGWFRHVVAKYSEYPEIDLKGSKRVLGVVGSCPSYLEQAPPEILRAAPKIAQGGTGIFVQYNPPQ